MSGLRIAFINPFGTDVYDGLIRETLQGRVRTDTLVDVFHIDGAPRNIDYYWPKHLIETRVFDKVIEVEEQGYVATVIGCCYDPGVRVARELVDIPVVGPLEAAMALAGYFGHSYTIVTDHHKAVPYLEDLVLLYGGRGCRGVRAIDWWVEEMIEDRERVAHAAAAACVRALEEDRSEVVILGCTIIGGCLEAHMAATGQYRDLPVLNPNLLAVKTAELLGDLHRAGQYNLSRRGYYQKQSERDPEEFAETRRRFRLGDLG